LPVTAPFGGCGLTSQWVLGPVGGLGLGSVGMDANEPGLFDLPTGERPGTVSRAVRGRNRQTWVRTAKALVTVIDAGALHKAAALAAEDAGAADPFAPLHSIPGIVWRPGPVNIEYLPAKTAGAH
jgi:hypothetical protein